MRRFWSEEEDQILRKFVGIHGKQWKIIASKLPRRTPTQIAARWEKCLNPNLIKGPFTSEEDQIILKFVEKNGPHSWPSISKMIPGRSPKQCRERWFNHLNPNVSKSSWSYNEDMIIFDLYNRNGPKWSIISKSLPGRTDNAVKNRWHSSITKRIKYDLKGNKTLMPDTSKRNKHKQQMESLRPPPLMTLTENQNNDLNKNELSEVKSLNKNVNENDITPPNFIPDVYNDIDGMCCELEKCAQMNNINQSFLKEKSIDSFDNLPVSPSNSLFSPTGLNYNHNCDVMMSPFSPHDNLMNPLFKSESFELTVSPTKISDYLFSPNKIRDSEFGA